MKNNKINIKTFIIIVLILIIIIMFFVILNIKNKNIARQEIVKEQLEELATDNSYISLSTHISELDEKQQQINNMQNTAGQATATADKILKNYTAYKDGKLITGTMENRGTWTNTPTTSGKVTIPAGYHNGSGYVDTSKVYTNGYNAGYNEGSASSSYKLLASNLSSRYTQAVSASSIANYQNLTVNNFLVVNRGLTYVQYRDSEDITTMTKSYNASTGVLSLGKQKSYCADYTFWNIYDVYYIQ